MIKTLICLKTGKERNGEKKKKQLEIRKEKVRRRLVFILFLFF